MELNMDQKVALFKALGNPTRFMMFKMIFTKSVTCSIDKRAAVSEADAEAICVSTLSSQFHFAMPTISKHLKELRQAGLVIMEKRGNKIYVEANVQTIKSIAGCFTDLIARIEGPAGAVS